MIGVALKDAQVRISSPCETLRGKLSLLVVSFWEAIRVGWGHQERHLCLDSDGSVRRGYTHSTHSLFLAMGYPMSVSMAF